MKKEELEQLQQKVNTYVDFRAYIDSDEFVFYIPLDIRDDKAIQLALCYPENVKSLPDSILKEAKLIWLGCDYFELKKGNITFQKDKIQTTIKTKNAEKIIFNKNSLEIKVFFSQNEEKFIAQSPEAFKEIKKIL